MEDTQMGGAQTSQVGDQAGNVDPKQSGDSAGSSKQTETKSTRTVSWDNHQRVLEDMHDYKRKMQEALTRLGDLESQKLREKEDWKSLAHNAEARAKAAEEKYEKLNGLIVKNEKFREVTKHAVAKGLRPDALKDLELLPDLSGVDVEATTNGRLLVHGADTFVETLKTERPHWFKQDQPPKINGDGGGTLPLSGKKLTVQDVLDAEKQSRMGKISKETYHNMRLQYDKQERQTRRN